MLFRVKQARNAEIAKTTVEMGDAIEIEGREQLGEERKRALLESGKVREIGDLRGVSKDKRDVEALEDVGRGDRSGQGSNAVLGQGMAMKARAKPEELGENDRVGGRLAIVQEFQEPLGTGSRGVLCGGRQGVALLKVLGEVEELRDVLLLPRFGGGDQVSEDVRVAAHDELVDRKLARG